MVQAKLDVEPLSRNYFILCELNAGEKERSILLILLVLEVVLYNYCEVLVHILQNPLKNKSLEQADSESAPDSS